jgi:hypothetical protein
MQKNMENKYHIVTKRNIAIASVALGILLVAGAILWPKTKTPIEYYNEIVTELSIAQTIFEDFDALDTTDRELADSGLEILAGRVDKARIAIKDMPTVEEGKAMKEKALEILDYYDQIIAEDFQALVELAFDPETTSEAYALDTASRQATFEAELERLDIELVTLQVEFAIYHEFQLVSDEEE